MRKPSNITIAFALCAVAWVVIVARTIFVEQPKRETIAAQSDVNAFAKTTLNGLQRRSFDNDREYCGLIFEDDEGALSTSEISAGTEAECQFAYTVPMGKFAIATFHTHGGFNDGYDSEAPSLLDMETDLDDRIDGYISTPGGRIWHIDWQVETASQLCGVECIRQDPRYQPCPAFLPNKEYDLNALRERVKEDREFC